MDKVNKNENSFQVDLTEADKWWKNDAMVAELQERYNNWRTGKDKGFRIEEIITEITRLKK